MSARTSIRAPGMARRQGGAFGGIRTTVLALAHAAVMGVSSVAGSPIPRHGLELAGSDFDGLDHHDNVPEAEGASRVVLYIVSMVLVLLGGAFAGLTIALMGQDSIYLQVLAGDANDAQNKNAKRVYRLLQRGKHWVLVTLLLSNVIVNETLPVVLDRCFGGGVAAVIGSTVLIVIFGEVVPQSVCVRYGLSIGGFMSGPVLLLMWLMAPVAWPIAKLLDWVLGEDHGTVYKKSGLKTLVGLHQSLGDVGERLNEDEVTIISAVLDLKGKQVGNVMTPMDDVFTVSEDMVLDEDMMHKILSEGYSRIPVHAAGQPTNFVGMLLVKILITYDPEDGMLVKDFPLATLPETRPETSCLDIINFFQEGKSHMVLVSEFPGENRGALGIVCLEDVIEELIGEEIIDESDVYIDVHKAIRRLAPAPKARPAKKDSTSMTLINTEDVARTGRMGSVGGPSEAGALSSSPRAATFLLRRASSGPDGQLVSAVPYKANFDEVRETLRHLGPSNPATNPRNTRSTAVKIKPGVSAASAVTATITSLGDTLSRTQSASSDTAAYDVPEDDENSSLLKPLLTGKNGVHALRKSYGSSGRSATQSRLSGHSPQPTDDDDEASSSTIRPHTRSSAGPSSSKTVTSGTPSGAQSPLRTSGTDTPPNNLIGRNSGLTEDLFEHGGVQKIVIRTTSSGSSLQDDSPSPTSTTAISRPRTWSIRDRFGTAASEPAPKTAAQSSTKPAETQEQSNGKPLLVVPDTSSPVEFPIAEAIIESIDNGELDAVARPPGEPATNPFDAAARDASKSPASKDTQGLSSQTSGEPSSQSQPTQEPASQVSEEISYAEAASQPPQHPAGSANGASSQSQPHQDPTSQVSEMSYADVASQPPQHPTGSADGTSSPTLGGDDVISPGSDPRSPIGNVLEEEDLNASTVSLGASSTGGGSGGKSKKKKKGKRNKRGTAF
jgi:metal transporter CNNM